MEQRVTVSEKDIVHKWGNGENYRRNNVAVGRGVTMIIITFRLIYGWWNGLNFDKIW